MKKIPTLFIRDFAQDDGEYVTGYVTVGCEWVMRGEGRPTRKYDGTCVQIDNDGDVWTRREVRRGAKTPPSFIEVEHDNITGKTVGWIPYEQSPFAWFIVEALNQRDHPYYISGTYELCGPKINKNPDGFATHKLIRHKDAPLVPFLYDAPYVYGTVYNVVTKMHQHYNYEGIVWHHPDGRMAKIKFKDLRPNQNYEVLAL